MRFIALILAVTLAATTAFAQGLDKQDYKVLSIGKITLENVSTDVESVSVQCYTFMESADGINKNNMNDPKRWFRSGHTDIANYVMGGDDRKKKVISSQKITMFRNEGTGACSNCDKSYACQITLISPQSIPTWANAGGTPAWAQGSGNYFVKGSF